jgi:hypothetical protein
MITAVVWIGLMRHMQAVIGSKSGPEKGHLDKDLYLFTFILPINAELLYILWHNSFLSYPLKLIIHYLAHVLLESDT